MIKISGVNFRAVRFAEQRMQTGLASRYISDAFPELPKHSLSQFCVLCESIGLNSC